MSIQQLFFNSGVPEPVPLMTATGGTISYSGNYAYHYFYSSYSAQTFTVTYRKPNVNLTYDMTLIGSGEVGGPGGEYDEGHGSVGGVGGSGGRLKELFTLSVPASPSNSAQIMVDPGDINATAVWSSGGPSYTSSGGPYDNSGGSAGEGADPDNEAGTGSAGTDIIPATTYLGVQAGSGGGGGGGGCFNTYPSGGPGGSGGGGGGAGGDGGSHNNVAPTNGANGSGGYGMGGGGGGGAYEELGPGGSGGTGTGGVVLIVYQFQTTT